MEKLSYLLVGEEYGKISFEMEKERGSSILSLIKLAKLSSDEAVKTNILIWRSEEGFKLVI